MPPGHYFDPDPAVASRPTEVELALPEGRLRLATDRGVFAAGRIDAGTLALLRALPAGRLATEDPPVGEAARDLLDLGCGYGPIAVALARRHPAATVWALDVNRRALDLVATNAARHGLGNVRPVTAADIPSGLGFAEIWSNPPIRAGKAVLHELLAGWLPRLEATGRARLVVHRHLGADSLASWLADEGWSVRRIASKSGYRILDVTRAP